MNIVRLIGSLLLGILSIVAVADRSHAAEVEIWIRSYIPNQHDSNPGYIMPVPGQPGETMIPGPIPGVSDCFLTDQRTASLDPSASSRLAGRVKIDADGETIAAEFLPSTSVEVDCEDGDEECREPVDTSRSVIGQPAVSGGRVSVNVHGEANNACFTGSPDIHFDGDFVVDFNARTISFTGSIGKFPAFEALARFDGGAIKAIFAEAPAAGSSALDVPSSRSVDSGSVQF